MKVLVFAGTTEGREFSARLSSVGMDHFVCVATEYGGMIMKDAPHVTLMEGRLDVPGMERTFFMEGISHCVDATHPFAEEVTENIKTACANTGVTYIRIKREGMDAAGHDLKFFDSHEECLKTLMETEGNILLTTGSKDLETYCDEEEVRKRLYARVLPGMESLKICDENRIRGKQVIAMQGPFTHDMNVALIKSLDIKVMVSKQSGKNGGFLEKVTACEDTATELFVVGMPKNYEGISIKEGVESLGIDWDKTSMIEAQAKEKEQEKIKAQEDITSAAKITSEPEEVQKIQVSLVGTGMGDLDCLTIEAKKAIENADHVLGAKRIVSPYIFGKKSSFIYTPEDIGEYIRTKVSPEESVAVLFSGDTGFYSGAKKLSLYLSKVRDTNVSVYPGISSFSYFAARLGVSYDDAAIVSLHGKHGVSAYENLKEAVKSYVKTFVLLSDGGEIAKIYKMLHMDENRDVHIMAGRNLSYGNEEIVEITEKNYKDFSDGLFILYIESDMASVPFVSGYIADDEFIREKVPMTKQGIRTLALAALKLKSDSVLYDIGAGTGSVSIEAAGLSSDISVYSVEKKDEAVDLLYKNIEKFEVENIKVIKGEAPEALDGLEAPTHAFIGGSSGNLRSILDCLYKKNKECRVVITAVSLETIGELSSLSQSLKTRYFDIKQVSITGTRRIGNHTLMDAQNPVYICELEFSGE